MGRKSRIMNTHGKAIWFGGVLGEALVRAMNERGRGTMSEYLGIVFTEAGDDWIKGTMPVDHRTKQPAGILHGGASVVLAETLGSTAANLGVDRAKQYCVGLDINANHVRSCKDGTVEGVARPLHIGKTTHVWEIRISQAGKLVCVSRLTMAVLDRK
jgi:1,4-dihydroxy-2-naphthoyl-CoA hydrolase